MLTSFPLRIFIHYLVFFWQQGRLLAPYKLYFGLPRLDQADRKEKVVRVRLTLDDLTAISRLHGLSIHRSLSDLIRTILPQKPVSIQVEETGLEQLSNVL
jgi:hypothetical protein